MNEEDVRTFEKLAEQAYGPNKEARVQAEQKLAVFNNPESLQQLQFLLQKTKHPYSILFICAQLLKLFTNCWNNYTKKQHIEMRNFLIQYLGTIGVGMPEYLKKNVNQLLGRVAKLSWLDEPSNKDIPEQVKKYFIYVNPNNAPNPMITNFPLAMNGMQILNNLIMEMNTLTSRKTLTQHRKIAVAFRDQSLRVIFEIATQVLGDLLQRKQQNQYPQDADFLLDEALNVVLNSMKFDFVGIFPDESTDDVGTVQVPATWRQMFEEGDIIGLFWNWYAVSSSKIQCKVLQILVSMASIRRSLFTGDDERKQYLQRFLSGMEKLMQSNMGLQNHDTYHEYCRLLARLKANFQLNEFVSCNNYQAWIDACVKFSQASFKNWQFSAPSVYYILNFWSRLIASKPYLKADQPSYLETIVPEICKSYLFSRMELASGIARDDAAAIDNPLENEQHLEEQLESIPQLVYANYEITGNAIQQAFDNIFNAYQQVKYKQMNNMSLQLHTEWSEVMGQLAWLIYISGCVLGKRYVSSSSSDDAEAMDANLSARCIKCIALIHEQVDRLTKTKNQQLYDTQDSSDDLLYLIRWEMSMLYFLKHLKRVYIGDTMVTHPKLFGKLKDLLQISDQTNLLNMIVTKIIHNLKIWNKSEMVLKETLGLFDDIATGYSSAKLASKLDSVQHLLQNHALDHQTFLATTKNMRLRTLFYNTLCKLLFLQSFTDDQFIQLMQPLATTCKQLESVPSLEQFRSEPVKFTLTGWLRDMRGICQACSNKRTYTLLFEWIFPTHVSLLMKCIQCFHQDASVMIALLKFVSEFVQNRNQRISFGSSSAHGILLFKETSQLLVAWGKSMLANNQPNVMPSPMPTPIPMPSPMPNQNQGPKKDVYNDKYKLIMIAMDVLSHALSGDYVNFGVFALYNDRSLLDALDVVIRWTLTIPLQEILSYPKLCKAYFTLVENLFHNHIETIIMFETPVFLKLLSSLEEGLKLEDLGLSSQTCSAIDHLLTFYYKHCMSITATQQQQPVPTLYQMYPWLNRQKTAERLHMHLQQHKNLFPRILAQLFNLIIFEECGNQWSVSRVMLTLIVTHPTFYEELKRSIIASVSGQERQQKLTECFVKLMEDVELNNLESKNRDKFTGNLITFRSDVRNFL